MVKRNFDFQVLRSVGWFARACLASARPPVTRASSLPKCLGRMRMVPASSPPVPNQMMEKRYLSGEAARVETAIVGAETKKGPEDGTGDKEASPPSPREGTVPGIAHPPYDWQSAVAHAQPPPPSSLHYYCSPPYGPPPPPSSLHYYCPPPYGPPPPHGAVGYGTPQPHQHSSHGPPVPYFHAAAGQPGVASPYAGVPSYQFYDALRYPMPPAVPYAPPPAAMAAHPAPSSGSYSAEYHRAYHCDAPPQQQPSQNSSALQPSAAENSQLGSWHHMNNTNNGPAANAPAPEYLIQAEVSATYSRAAPGMEVPSRQGHYAAPVPSPTNTHGSPVGEFSQFAPPNGGGSPGGAAPSPLATNPEYHHPPPPAQQTTCLPPHYTLRHVLPLALPEDADWLSEFLCFVRAHCVEVFEATDDDVVSRMSSKKVRRGQVGIRCRFCAHRNCGDRVGRSSSYPTTKSRIYQSLTMMLRDHFTKCGDMPPDRKDHFLRLKSNTSQGATDSKRYWVESAGKLGLVDTPEGLKFEPRA